MQWWLQSATSCAVPLFRGEARACTAPALPDTVELLQSLAPLTGSLFLRSIDLGEHGSVLSPQHAGRSQPPQQYQSLFVVGATVPFFFVLFFSFVFVSVEQERKGVNLAVHWPLNHKLKHTSAYSSRASCSILRRRWTQSVRSDPTRFPMSLFSSSTRAFSLSCQSFWYSCWISLRNWSLYSWNSFLIPSISLASSKRTEENGSGKVYCREGRFSVFFAETHG